MSPGGFDAFTLTADFPSLQMMSPQTGQSPFPGRAQPSSQQQQPLPSLAAQGSFEGLDSQPGQTPGQQHQQQQVQSSRGLSSFYGLPPLQTGASPAGEIKTPPEREHARMSPVQSSARVRKPMLPVNCSPCYVHGPAAGKPASVIKKHKHTFGGHKAVCSFCCMTGIYYAFPHWIGMMCKTMPTSQHVTLG